MVIGVRPNAASVRARSWTTTSVTRLSIERVTHVTVDRRDEIDPVRRQARGEVGNVDDRAGGQAAHPGIRRDHLAVGGDLGSADLVHAGIDDERAHEVVDEIACGDGLDPGVHPAGAHHEGQPFGEVPQHLERDAAAADHHGGPQLHHRHPGIADRGPHLLAAAEVLGAGIVTEPADVDDARHRGGGRRPSEPRGQLQVAGAEVVAGHGVDEVIGAVAAREELRATAAWSAMSSATSTRGTGDGRFGRASGDGGDRVTLRREPGDEEASDESRRADHGEVHGAGNRGLGGPVPDGPGFRRSGNSGAPSHVPKCTSASRRIQIGSRRRTTVVSTCPTPATAPHRPARRPSPMTQFAAEPVLDVEPPADGRAPTAAVLVLHGGRERSHEAVEPEQLAVRRMAPFARDVGQRLPDVAVARLRYRVRGWNGDGHDVLADVDDAIGRLATAVRAGAARAARSLDGWTGRGARRRRADRPRGGRARALAPRRRTGRATRRAITGRAPRHPRPHDERQGLGALRERAPGRSRATSRAYGWAAAGTE